MLNKQQQEIPVTCITTISLQKIVRTSAPLSRLLGRTKALQQKRLYLTHNTSLQRKQSKVQTQPSPSLLLKQYSLNNKKKRCMRTDETLQKEHKKHKNWKHMVFERQRLASSGKPANGRSREAESLAYLSKTPSAPFF